MPRYIMLSTIGPDGAATLRENPERLKAVNAEVEAMGVKVIDQYALLGDYDFLNIVEAHDAATVAKVSVALGARGSAKLQTYELIDIDALLARLSE